MRVSEPAVVGVQGSEVSHSSWRISVRVKCMTTVRKYGSTHVIPYDAMLCVLRRDPLKAAGLGGSNASYFATRGESVHATDKQLKLILILLAISRAMQVGISRFETL